MDPLHRRWALVTGASPGGLGDAEVSAFLKRGINVVSTSPEIKEVQSHKPRPGSYEGFMIALHMDVMSSKSIQAAVDQVEQLTDGKLHYLVNNAGYVHYTPLMDVDIDKAKTQFDVNVWGVLRVTQAFFPMLRAAKGMVVNQCDIAGVENFNRPFLGIYSSSKAAVMSLSATMRVELSPFEIDVVALVTSAVKREISTDRVGGRVSKYSAYWPVKAEVNDMMSDSLANRDGHDRYEVAEATIQRLLEDPTPIFIRKGFQATFLSWMYWLVPASILDSWAVRDSPLGLLKQMISPGDRDGKVE